MDGSYFSDTIEKFKGADPSFIIGNLTRNSQFSILSEQTSAWESEIEILKKSLSNLKGKIYFEYSIPRMGKRIDVLLIIKSAIFILEFKIGEKKFKQSAVDQVWDYALDLKNFHEESHDKFIIPILVSPDAEKHDLTEKFIFAYDKVLNPVKVNAQSLKDKILEVLSLDLGAEIDAVKWEEGRYSPSPSIIEAALSLYNGHSVSEISRKDANAVNLSLTSDFVSKIIEDSRKNSQKSICFVTGVPGAGKTLVGLNIATKYIEKDSELHSVFLSGNGPLVQILHEALARDKYKKEKEKGNKVKKETIKAEVKMFIQNIHHFRDDCLKDMNEPPIEHAVIFDEAQRVWNKEQTVKFMIQKKKKLDFNQSEPEFLISCMDRHPDWAVIICLVGEGQEINTGEAGIGEWIQAAAESFPDWKMYISPRIEETEFSRGMHGKLKNLENVFFSEDLHLSVSMRTFRTENYSILIKNLLDLKSDEAIKSFDLIRNKFPIAITRDLAKAKQWLREKARGSERYGIVVSSVAQRLKPYAIDVKSPVDPVHWFLDGKDDIRSSYYLEDVVTEYKVQGLEIDWVCLTWDADFRFNGVDWENYAFVGDKWNHIRKMERKLYQKNSYRVLLTRARMGMIIFVPYGDSSDPTRKASFYDSTYAYLKKIGFSELIE